MNSLTLIFAALCIFAIAYRIYGIFIANKVMNLRDDRETPAVTQADGHDYVKTNKYILFGHHFAAIAAAGPLLGPVLAAQFGFLPGALWILVGAVLAGGQGSRAVRVAHAARVPNVARGRLPEDAAAIGAGEVGRGALRHEGLARGPGLRRLRREAGQQRSHLEDRHDVVGSRDLEGAPSEGW